MLPRGFNLPENWQEIQRRMLTGEEDLSKVRLIPEPDQVWQAVGVVPDKACLAYDEKDAQMKLETKDVKRIR